MDLFLWRHADAGTPVAGPADLQRPLTAKGRRQARRMAAWLDRQLPADARVLVSPALRTRETALALERPSRVVDALGPAASADDLLGCAGWPDGGGAVLLVGHQPALGQAAALVLSGLPLAWTLKKGSVWWLRGERSAAGLTVLLRAVRLPGEDQLQ